MNRSVEVGGMNKFIFFLGGGKISSGEKLKVTNITYLSELRSIIWSKFSYVPHIHRFDILLRSNIFENKLELFTRYYKVINSKKIWI